MSHTCLASSAYRQKNDATDRDCQSEQEHHQPRRCEEGVLLKEDHARNHAAQQPAKLENLVANVCSHSVAIATGQAEQTGTTCAALNSFKAEFRTLN